VVVNMERSLREPDEVTLCTVVRGPAGAGSSRAAGTILTATLTGQAARADFAVVHSQRPTRRTELTFSLSSPILNGSAFSIRPRRLCVSADDSIPRYLAGTIDQVVTFSSQTFRRCLPGLCISTSSVRISSAARRDWRRADGRSGTGVDGDAGAGSGGGCLETACAASPRDEPENGLTTRFASTRKSLVLEVR